MKKTRLRIDIKAFKRMISYEEQTLFALQIKANNSEQVLESLKNDLERLENELERLENELTEL